MTETNSRHEWVPHHCILVPNLTHEDGVAGADTGTVTRTGNVEIDGAGFFNLDPNRFVARQSNVRLHICYVHSYLITHLRPSDLIVVILTQ